MYKDSKILRLASSLHLFKILKWSLEIKEWLLLLQWSLGEDLLSTFSGLLALKARTHAQFNCQFNWVNMVWTGQFERVDTPKWCMQFKWVVCANIRADRAQTDAGVPDWATSSELGYFLSFVANFWVVLLTTFRGKSTSKYDWANF